MNKTSKKHASTPKYVSPNQLVLDGFSTPFDKALNPENRWVVLAHLIPWDDICNIYLKHVGINSTGRCIFQLKSIPSFQLTKHAT